MEIITLESVVKEAPASSSYVSNPYVPAMPEGNVVANQNNNVIAAMSQETDGKTKKPYILPAVLSAIGLYVLYKTLI